MKLVNAKGLSNNLIGELQKDIEAKAKELVGEVSFVIPIYISLSLLWSPL